MKPNPWLVAAAVVIPTFMEVLDTTIANVALRHMAGGLSAAQSDAEWVITSYLAANAIILPLSGWLSTRLGRRNYFLASIALFTIASALCGAARSLGALIAFRVLQGLAGGGLQPSTQGILLDTFPPEKQGAAMATFGVAALVAPILGPTLGGWITDHASWRWIFYINIPVGVAALYAAGRLVEDPPYLVERRAATLARNAPFDSLGLGLLVLTMSAFEILISKGHEWDWLGDPWHRVHALAVVSLVSLGLLVRRELTYSDPVINLRPLADRNFALASGIAFATFGALYGATTLFPTMLQSLFGYNALRSGQVLSPAGFFSVSMMPVIAVLLGRGTDARKLIAAGLVIMAAGFVKTAGLTLDAAPSHFIVSRIVQIVGLSLIFAPLTVAAYMNLPHELRPAATGLYSLLRNEGGSVGVSLARAFTEHRLQGHTARLNESLNPFNPALGEVQAQATAAFLQVTGDPAASEAMALQSLANLRGQQSALLAYFDTFRALALLALALSLTVTLMRRSVATSGEHLAAE